MASPGTLHGCYVRWHRSPDDDDDDDDDDDVELNVLGCRVDVLGTNCDQCVSMVQCCFTSFLQVNANVLGCRWHIN